VPVPSFYHQPVAAASAVVEVQAVFDRRMDSLEDDPAVDLPCLLEDPGLSLPCL
jgi:hypothetical protein